MLRTMPTTRAQQLAERVKAARLARGMTQTDLAAAVNVHPQTIGNLERATHETSLDVVARIEKALGVDLSAASLAASQAVDLIEDTILDRIEDMDPAESLLFVGEVMRYVLEWHPVTRDQRRRRHANNNEPPEQ